MARKFLAGRAYDDNSPPDSPVQSQKEADKGKPTNKPDVYEGAHAGAGHGNYKPGEIPAGDGKLPKPVPEPSRALANKQEKVKRKKVKFLAGRAYDED